jgi:hypothetical protein
LDARGESSRGKGRFLDSLLFLTEGIVVYVLGATVTREGLSPFFMAGKDAGVTSEIDGAWFEASEGRWLLSLQNSMDALVVCNTHPHYCFLGNWIAILSQFGVLQFQKGRIRARKDDAKFCPGKALPDGSKGMTHM